MKNRPDCKYNCYTIRYLDVEVFKLKTSKYKPFICI